MPLDNTRLFSWSLIYEVLECIQFKAWEKRTAIVSTFQVSKRYKRKVDLEWPGDCNKFPHYFVCNQKHDTATF